MSAIKRARPFAMLALATAACSASPTSDDASAAHKMIARADYVAALSAAFCDAFASCCAAADHAFDPSQCRAVVDLHGLYPEFDAADLRADYDPVAAADCLDARVQATRDCRYMTSKEAEPCGRVFHGQVAPGAACAYTAECSSTREMTAFCFPQQAPTSPSTCVAEPPGPRVAGEACDGNEIDTADGGFLQGGSLRCPARDGLRCNFDLGVCDSLPQLGAPCTWHMASGETWYDACADGAYCDPIAETCVAQQTSGSCAARINDPPVTTRPCAVGTFCDTDYQCRSELPDGAPCTLYASCAAHICNSEQRCGLATALACENHPL